jgi:hypothetical protein
MTLTASFDSANATRSVSQCATTIPRYAPASVAQYSLQASQIHPRGGRVQQVVKKALRAGSPDLAGIGPGCAVARQMPASAL